MATSPWIHISSKTRRQAWDGGLTFRIIVREQRRRHIQGCCGIEAQLPHKCQVFWNDFLQRTGQPRGGLGVGAHEAM